MSAAFEVRTAAILAGEIARKKARKDALQFRPGEISAELETLRTAQARALADGSDNTSRASLSASVQEQEGITRAIGMLESDSAGLESEHANAVQLETQSAEATAFATATAAFDELEATVRTLARDRILPQADAFTQTARELRIAGQTAEHARKKAGHADSMFGASDPVERITRRRGALLAVVESMRKYVET